MRPDLANAALQLLQRVTINPQEIQTFLQVQQALQQEAQQPQVATPETDSELPEGLSVG